jgi:hypothetical protein
MSEVLIFSLSIKINNFKHHSIIKHQVILSIQLVYNFC